MNETVNTNYFCLYKSQFEEFSKQAEELNLPIDYFLMEFCELRNVPVD